MHFFHEIHNIHKIRQIHLPISRNSRNSANTLNQFHEIFGVKINFVDFTTIPLNSLQILYIWKNANIFYSIPSKTVSNPIFFFSWSNYAIALGPSIMKEEGSLLIGFKPKPPFFATCKNWVMVVEELSPEKNQPSLQLLRIFLCLC